MAYDPDWPPHEAELTSAAFRVQFTGLHALLPASAAVLQVLTGPPGTPASATAVLTGGALHFTFTLPEGAPGAPGPPGEVTQAQLSNDLVNTQNAAVLTVLPLTSNNTNAVGTEPGSISDPPTQAEVTALRDKLNDLILALRR